MPLWIWRRPSPRRPSSATGPPRCRSPGENSFRLPNSKPAASGEEQDQGLEKLEETVPSTKHIALAVNEELDLQTSLIKDLDDHVDGTNSHLQRVQKRLAVLNKRAKVSCSCISLLLSVVAIVILAVIVLLLVKDL